jgi:hypothetical protein
MGTGRIEWMGREGGGGGVEEKLEPNDTRRLGRLTVSALMHLYIHPL